MARGTCIPRGLINFSGYTTPNPAADATQNHLTIVVTSLMRCKTSVKAPELQLTTRLFYFSTIQTSCAFAVFLRWYCSWNGDRRGTTDRYSIGRGIDIVLSSFVF